MDDLYLRTDTEQEMIDLLLPVAGRDDIAIDVIGTIYKPVVVEDAPVDPDWTPPQPEACPGWHANVRILPVDPDEELVELVAPLREHALDPPPDTPRRVWL